MADEEIVAGNQQTEPDGYTSLRAAEEMRRAVKALVTKQHDDGTVRQRVVEELAEELITERVALLRKALAKREELQKKVHQTRPDQVSLDDKGKKIAETFSKARYEELKKAQEDLEKMDKAIDKAVNGADYELVKNLVK